MENKRADQVLSENWYQWEQGGCGEKGEYGANTVYTCMQMEK
jgi:hypothetical protein